MDTFDQWLEGRGPVRTVLRTLVYAARAWIDGRAIRLGAAVAFYGLFAIIPVLMLAIALASVFIDEARVTAEVQAVIADLVGEELANAIVEAFTEFTANDGDLIVSLIGLGALLFSATLLFVAWKDVVDIMWDEPRVKGARGTIQRRLFGVVAVLGAGALLTLNLMADTIVGFLDAQLHSGIAEFVIDTTGTFIPMLLGMVFIGILYKYTPEVEIAWRSVILASIVTMTMLAVGAWVYGIYIENFGFQSASGVAGTVFLGLVLVYYGAMILLYGMEIVRVKHKAISQASTHSQP